MSRGDLAALGALFLVALAWAGPLAAHPFTAIPGTRADPDVMTMVWNVGWVHYALEAGVPLLRSETILVPFGADLRLHAFGVFPALLVWPIAQWLDVVAAFNVMLMATLVLNGWFGYLLLRSLPAGRAAAVVAAGALTLSGPVLQQMGVGRPTFASIWITCAALISARRVIARPTVLWSAALGVALVAALFTDFQVLLFTGLWLALLAAWTMWCERGIDPRRVAGGVLALAILAVPFATIFYPALSGAAAAGIDAPSRAEAVAYSYRWWDYFTPAMMPLALGGYEMVVAAVAGLVLVRREPRLRFWLFGAGVLFTLALGPELKFTQVPLPFAVLRGAWPPLEQFRSPYRLTIPAMIGLAAVMALGLDRALAPLSRRWLAVVVAAALALRVSLALLLFPLATQTPPAYETYRRLAREDGQAALLEVPFGVRSGMHQIGRGAILQYYQHVHRKPIINAMVARLPAKVFDFYRSHPSLLFLAGEPVNVPAEDVAQDLEEVIDLIGAGYVLVHRELLDVKDVRAVESLLEGHRRLERLTAENDLVIYRVVPASTSARHDTPLRTGVPSQSL
jgi:hypothetical protein